jgi:PmbA protein
MERNQQGKTIDSQSLATEMLDRARRTGADEADVYIVLGRDFEVNVRNGKVELLKRASLKGVGIRVFVDHRMGFSHTTDFSSPGLAKLIEDTVQMARHATRDEYNGLPENCGPARENDLDIFDPKIAGISTDEKISLAMEMEESARATDPRVKMVEDATFSDSEEEVLIANTKGFLQSYKATGCALVCSVVAEANNTKQVNYWYTHARHRADLETPRTVGQRAAQRAVQMLGARKIPSGKFPVLFDPLVASSFLATIASALNGESVHRKTSFLTDKLGENIASTMVTVVDDGTLKRGLSSCPFDGEGVPTVRTVIIERGVLKSYLYDSYTARKANTQSTGNAVRGYSTTPRIGPLNFYLQPGTTSPQEMIRTVKRGFYVTGMIGFGVDTVSGQYSRGASGLWIEDGEVAYPIHEVTVASTMLEMLRNIEMIGNDLEFRSPFASPTIKFAEMSVSGL